MIAIRSAQAEDEDAIWSIFQAVVRTGDTYAYPPDTPRDSLSELWLGPAKRTYVAELDGRVAGTYILKPNHPGLASHVANASYMVHPDFQGRGLGSAMCDQSLLEARRLGYRAVQFNLVVSTNENAVRLWRRKGFKIIGTIPDAFKHSRLGYVDAYIMHRAL